MLIVKCVHLQLTHAAVECMHRALNGFLFMLYEFLNNFPSDKNKIKNL